MTKKGERVKYSTMQKDIQQSITEEIEQQRLFNSQTFGELTFKEVAYHIGHFMHEDPKAQYEVVIGSDSQQYSSRVDFVSAIIVHRFGGGRQPFQARPPDPSRRFQQQLSVL